MLQYTYLTAPADKDRSCGTLKSKKIKKLLCDEQEARKSNRKEETKAKDKKLFLRNTDKCD
jgi:hypothetical protein